MDHTTLSSSASTDNAYIATSYARALLRTVEEQGHDASLILADEPVGISAIHNSEMLDAAVFGRMYQRAIRLLDDESLGMVSGSRVMPGTFRMMCLCVVHCDCLNDVLTRAGEFLDICSRAGVKPEAFQRDGYPCIGFAAVAQESRTIEQILDREKPVTVRTSLYMWKSLLSWFAGRNILLREVAFAFEEPARGRAWQDMFRCPVRFDSARSYLSFEQGTLELPNVQNEQTLSVFLKSAPYRLIFPSFQQDTLSDRVQAVFGDDFSRSLPDARQVSVQLGMSVSTLRRQLNREGTSFQRLKDDCRRTAALQYLASNELSLAEVSGLLGFDDTSAFFRAFRRWTGHTPSEYRSSLQDGVLQATRK